MYFKDNYPRMKEIFSQIVLGNDTNKSELLLLIDKFFTNVSQQDLENSDKEFMSSFVKCYDKLKKEKLTHIDRAFIDLRTNKEPINYLYFDKSFKYESKKIKQIVNELTRNYYTSSIIPSSEKNKLVGFMGFLFLNDESIYDNIELESEDKDFYINISIETQDSTNSNLSGNINIFILAKREKNYEKFIDLIKSYIA